MRNHKNMQKKLRLRFDFRLCSRMASGQNWDQSGLDTNNHSRRVIEVGWRLFLENVKKPNSKRSNRLCENQIGCAFWANMIMFHCYFYQDLWSLMLVLDCNSYSYGQMGHLRVSYSFRFCSKLDQFWCDLTKIPNLAMVLLIEKLPTLAKFLNDRGILNPKNPFIGTLRFHWWRHFVCRHHYIFS